MRARVTMVRIQPDKAEEAASLFESSVLPAMQQQEGFKGALFLADPDTGKGISVTMWESEAAMERSEDSGFYKEQLAKFGSFFAEPPRAEHYEVRAQA